MLQPWRSRWRACTLTVAAEATGEDGAVEEVAVEAAALRDEVSNLDAEIDVLRGALKAAGDRVTAASLEERAREAARAILAASSRR